MNGNVTAVFHARAVSGQDSLGNDVYTDTSTTVAGCLFDPGGSVEITQGRDLVTTTPTLYAPRGTQVGAPDWVAITGVPRKFEVDGVPKVWSSATWTPDHNVVVKLREVTG